MKEAVFNTEIVRSFKRLNCWCYKVPDMPFGRGNLFTRFNPSKPCDIIVLNGLDGFLVEGKQIKSLKSFGMKSMRPSQIENLNFVTDNGGLGFVFLNIRLHRDNRLVVFEWSKFRRFKKNFRAKEVAGFKFIRGSKGVFELKPILRMVRRIRKQCVKDLA